MKKAVLLINLGTPESAAPEDVKAFLRQFLSDRRVIDVPRWKWQPILHLMILPRRPQKSAALYRKIVLGNQQLPLKYYTQQQASLLQEHLPDYLVKYAFSYAKPTIGEVLAEFEAEHVSDVTIIPLYPQYSTTTTGSVLDDVNRFYYGRPYVPSLHIVSDFCDSEAYIAALTQKIKRQIAVDKPDLLLFSYHGIPVSYAEKGDPYPERCQLTTKLIMEKLGDIAYRQTFQSRFGPEEWLKPATDETIKHLAEEGIKKVLVVSPSFVADCLETLYELDIENRTYFLENQGQQYTFLPSLNADDSFISALASFVEKQAVR